MINPFEPVYKNILFPLLTSQIQPYVTLYKQSLQPIYQMVTQPCKSKNQAVERYVACIKTLELIAQFSIYFFLYQKGFHLGTHYFGLVGGAAAFSLIYSAGHFVDKQLHTNMIDICTGTWLYYKGITTLTTNREALLGSIIIAGHLTQKEEKPHANSWEKKRKATATWLADSFFTPPKPALEQRPSGLVGKSVNRAQNPTDRKSQ
ncbi:MAG TPA: hypothetical protein VHK67_02090 [Rhabdochlamydiaceae bacterium]|jgi:hypothetical protein|nr:hypothetical protein [Rhabdochlamydiaceae bacterium]